MRKRILAMLAAVVVMAAGCNCPCGSCKKGDAGKMSAAAGAPTLCSACGQTQGSDDCCKLD